MNYIRIESDDCASNGLQSLNQSECKALTTDLSGIYNTFIDPASSNSGVFFENIVKIEEKSCAELGYEDLTTAECLKLGDFTAAASGQAIFPALNGLYSGCGGDGICPWSNVPRACIGLGTTVATRGKVVANYESSAGVGDGTGNPG